MKKFAGFPVDSKLSPTAFPADFFTELVPMIDDLAELKVTLYSFWAINQKEGDFRYLFREEYDNEYLIEGLKTAKPETDPQTALVDALAQVVERGTLLCSTLSLADKQVELFCVNTDKGRRAINQIQTGQWKPGLNGRPIEILPERPNIYRLYENNIGSLTPRIADHLKDAEKSYPIEWIQEAIHLAIDNNKRNWRYIAAILKRWETEGKHDEFTGRYAERDGQEYLTGQYARFIKR